MSSSPTPWRVHVCEMHLRAGDWERPRGSSTSGRSPLTVGCCSPEVRALPRAARRRARQCGGGGRWAEATIARGGDDRLRWDGLEALRALGHRRPAGHTTPERAAESLRSVWEHTEREGVDEPGVFPVAPDLVEALAELGEHEAARR